MLSKNELKYYSSLLQKKFRRSEGKFIAEGKRFVEEGLSANIPCEGIILSKSFAYTTREWVDEWQNKTRRLEVISDKDFFKLTDTKSPQGVAGIFHAVKPDKEPGANTIIALEDISDPGNLGTIIRLCDWFGFTDIILSPGCAELYNPKTVRSTMGSIFRVDVYEPENFIDHLRILKNKGYGLFIADMEGENVFEFKFPQKKIITFGSEAHGPTGKLLEIGDKAVTIPRYGKAESLNVAMAAGIIISRMKR